MKRTVWLKSLLVMVCAASALISTSLAAAPADVYAARVFTNASGATLPFRLLVPEGYTAGKKFPLVLFFHGAGERGNDNARQMTHGADLFLKPENRSQFPCFVLMPQCPENQQWVDMPWGTDSGTRPAQPSAAMQLALGALDQTIAQYGVDTDRLFVMGLSMGGYATWDCVTRFPERFAAGAPICGGGDETTVNATVAKLPIWAFHADDDTVVKPVRTRNMIAALKTAGGSPKYFEYLGVGHNSWSPAFAEPELLPWMFAQSRGKADSFKLKTPEPELPAVAKWPTSDDVFPGAGPLQKAEWFQKLWRQKRLSWSRSVAQDQGAVVFLGDSITQGWGSLAKDFSGLKVANRGISGDVTRGVRFRLKEDVLDLKPSAVVLLIGTNDLGLGGEPDPAVENIKVILAEFTKHNPRLPVIVCKVMPRQEQFAEKVKRLNDGVDTYIKDKPQFIRCDTWSIFADGQGAAKKEEFPDLLHPNEAGYAKWAAALKPIFSQLNLGGK